MEKRKPHCDLSVVKLLLAQDKIRSTLSALSGAAVLGVDFEGMVAIVKSLTPKDFYKSMTTNADHRLWQDVYRPKTLVGELYVKLMVIDDVLIVSFKEL